MENTKTSFMDKLQKVLLPIGTKLSTQRHLNAISAGLMAAIPLTVIGAFTQILANPPITQEIIDKGGLAAKILGGWFYFAQNNRDALMTPYNMTMGIFSLIVTFAIAYQLSKSYKMKSLSSAVIAVVVFLLIAAPATVYTLLDETTVTAMSISLLGGTGLFSGILIALSTVEITRMCEKYNIVIKMPAAVPPFLAESFSAMIPLCINVIIIYGLNLVSLNFFKLSLPNLITTAISAPLSAVNSVPGILGLIALSMLLWTLGVHGAMIMAPIIFPLLITAVTGNAELVAQGQNPVFQPIMIYGSGALIGGSGCTLGLVMMCAKSKSEQLKAIGRISFIPGIFGINEPVIFGIPILFNPIMAIPFVLAPVVVALFSWVGYLTGILKPSYILIMSQMPIGMSSFLGTMSWTNLLFPFVMIPVTMLVYYPFFKVYEKQLIEKEALQELEA